MPLLDSAIGLRAHEAALFLAVAATFLLAMKDRFARRGMRPTSASSHRVSAPAPPPSFPGAPPST